MRMPIFTAVMLFASSSVSGQTARRAVPQESGPQRTTGTESPKSSADTTASMTAAEEAYVRSAVETYRRSWERMGARTRKMLLSRGGQTPDQYERTLRQAYEQQVLQSKAREDFSSGSKQFVRTGRPAGASNAKPATAAPNGGMSTAESGSQLNLDVLNTMKTSGEDLNTIRDGNVLRIQKAGCPPEAALRVAELKSRLAAYESASGGQTGVARATGESAKDAWGAFGTAPVSAEDWFNSPAQQPPSEDPQARMKRELDSVLGANPQETAPYKPAVTKTPGMDQKREKAEAEVAVLRAQLEGLVAACAPR